jgi:protein-S-isoprenylcysteine O-methyltransferase
MERRRDPQPPPWAPNAAKTAYDSDDSDAPHPPPGTTFRDLGLHGARSFAGIATRAFLLGLVFALSAVSGLYLAFVDQSLWRIPFFLGALSVFHFFEFWTTAAYNTANCEIDSFLLTSNWPAYAIAHAAAALECLITHFVWPNRSHPPALVGVGLALVVVCQTVRSAAMIHAGQSFNHQVQQNRAESHKLVTEGIYRFLRHPSYFGFFWWAIGTQLVLGNWVCLVMYALVLWRFFSVRIRKEEVLLVKFFGNDYVEYRKRVGTLLPFC